MLIMIDQSIIYLIYLRVIIASRIFFHLTKFILKNDMLSINDTARFDSSLE
jgi:hypothetical protein